MNQLRDRIVLITGAGRGSGRLLAEALAGRGAVVAANDISPVNVEEVVDRILAAGGRTRAYVEDVSKKMAAQHIINQVEDDFGRIDILINHAAVQPRAALLDMDEWDWHRVLEVNLTGAFLMTQSAGRVMRQQGSGVIINLITTGQAAGNGHAAFAASMRGLEELTHWAARELSPHGIRVHAVEDRAETVVQEVLALLAR